MATHALLPRRDPGTRGDWKATVHRVARSDTRLKWLSIAQHRSLLVWCGPTCWPLVLLLLDFGVKYKNHHLDWWQRAYCLCFLIGVLQFQALYSSTSWVNFCVWFHSIACGCQFSQQQLLKRLSFPCLLCKFWPYLFRFYFRSLFCSVNLCIFMPRC